MFPLVGGVIMLVVSHVLSTRVCPLNSNGNCEQERYRIDESKLPPRLPDTYKDVFVAGQSGKPTLGTTSATCWARGGICVDIRECPSLNMDVGVSGCAWGYKVCCKVHKFLSPTVGVHRRYDLPVIKSLEDLGASLDIIALRNSMLLTDWQATKSSSDEVHIDNIDITN